MVRLKNRYLLVNILYPSPTTTTPSQTTPLLTLHQPTPPTLKPPDLLRSIKRTAHLLYGDHGSGCIAESLAIKYFSQATSTFIVRVSRKDYRIVWAALTFLDRVVVGEGGGGEREKERMCVFRVVRVCGTMKKAEEEAVRRARGLLLRLRREGEGRKADLMVVDGSEDDNSDDDGSPRWETLKWGINFVHLLEDGP